VNAEGKAAPHRVHKAKVILEALQGAETVNELTFEHDLKPQPGQELGRKGYL